MTSHVMDLTWLRQFQIIIDLASWGWLSHQSLNYLTFRINLPTFRSTFWIHFLNQPMQSAFSLNWRHHWLVIRRFFWQTYVHRRVLLPTEVCMIQIVNLLADHPLIEAWSVLSLSTPWWRYGWKLCWTQLGLLPCADISFVLKKVRVADENDKGLLVVDQWPASLTNM